MPFSSENDLLLLFNCRALLFNINNNMYVLNHRYEDSVF